MSQTDFPARIRKERKARGWTQEELADRAHVSLRTVQNVEGRKSTPQPENLRALLAALDIELAGDDVAAETRATWPPEIQVFLDMLGAYLMAMPERTRLDAIHDITRQIFTANS